MKKFSWKGARWGLFIGLFCMFLVFCIGKYAIGASTEDVKTAYVCPK